MATKIFSRIIIISFIIYFISCGEAIIEPDMANETVILLAPPDNYQTTLSTHTFWWEEVDCSTGYNLQIVSPNFNYIERLFLDTNITYNKYDFTLLPGEYEWRVRAYNYSTTSLFTVYSLQIDSTTDISQEILQLISPTNNDTTNIIDILFSWNPLYNADDYNFQLYYENNMIFSTTTIYDTISKTLDSGEGSYAWEVRGQNASSNTSYSSRTMYIDTTPPNKPSLITPDINATLPDTIINFEWNRGTVSGSSIMDSLYIASDISMNDIIKGVYLSNTYYEDSLGLGDFYWRVRSIDKAGNKSEYSNIRKFTIIPVD